MEPCCCTMGAQHWVVAKWDLESIFVLSYSAKPIINQLFLKRWNLNHDYPKFLFWKKKKSVNNNLTTSLLALLTHFQWNGLHRVTGQNWQMPFLDKKKKKKQYYAPFSKLIREIPIFETRFSQIELSPIVAFLRSL